MMSSNKKRAVCAFERDAVMKITYLGTAAAEGVPALFCHCETCRYARTHRGRELRSRSQALIDNAILIDFGPDTYHHVLADGLDFTDIEHCLITHAHGDHILIEQLLYRVSGFAALREGTKPLNLYASEDVAELLRVSENDAASSIAGRSIAAVLASDAIRVHTLVPFQPVQIGGYTVTPFPAFHGTPHPYFYSISRDGKSILYAHDTDIFKDEVWAYFRETRPYFDLVSMDCTTGLEPMEYHGHMNFERNLILRQRMLDEGFADEKTIFVSNHFSHNGHATYAAACEFAEKHGLLVSFDGMTLEV